LKVRITPPKRELLYNLYWEDGLSTVTLSKKFGVCQGTIYEWMKKLTIPTRNPHDWHYVNVDLSPTPTLAYILGVLVGDGNLKKYEVRLRALDKPFVKSFYNALQKLGFRPKEFIVKPNIKYGRPHMLYGVRAASKKFADWFRKLGMEGLRQFILQDKERTISFLRGFYESEGFSNRAGVCNTNKKLIEVVKEAIEKLGFTCYLCGPYKRENPHWKPIYILFISRTQGKDFIKFISPVIKNNLLGG
jgi:intein/homing endonuclease